MKTITLYQPRDTIIHKIDPLTKVLYIVTAILVPIILPYKITAAAFVVFSLLLLITAKVLKQVLFLLAFIFLILLSVILIQGLFYQANKTVAFSLGILIFYKEGLLFALNICIRVLNILTSFSILILTTKPSDLIETLIEKGLSPRIGYVLNSVLQIIPQMVSTTDTIMDAQRSRGMETEGNLFVRLKAFLPLIGPVVMNSLISTKERAMALEVRGFNSKKKKTFLNESFSFAYSRVLKILLVIILSAAIVWRIVLWIK